MLIIDQQERKEKLAQSMVQRCIKYANENDHMEMCGSLTRDEEYLYVASWMANVLRLTLKSSTYNTYKRALLSIISDPATHMEALRILSIPPSKGRGKLPKRTSSKRAKHVTMKEFYLLQDDSLGHKNKWGLIAIDWLRATMLTGLRPMEWNFAAYDEAIDMLIVPNVKLEHTVPEWGASSRKIPLSHVEDMDRLSIFATLEFMDGLSIARYQVTQRKVSNWLCAANSRVFPARRKTKITIMSGRHQFCANIKKSKLTPREIAYIMGHATDLRAYSTYGPARFGDGIDLATSHIKQESLDKIRGKIDLKSHHPSSSIKAPDEHNTSMSSE